MEKSSMQSDSPLQTKPVITIHVVGMIMQYLQHSENKCFEVNFAFNNSIGHIRNSSNEGFGTYSERSLSDRHGTRFVVVRLQGGVL
jgi:hypothetical protein